MNIDEKIVNRLKELGIKPKTIIGLYIVFWKERIFKPMKIIMFAAMSVYVTYGNKTLGLSSLYGKNINIQ